MRLAEFHHGQPLEPMLTQIMAEDLLGLLGAEDVIPVPQRRDVPLDRWSRRTSTASRPTMPARSCSTRAGASTRATTTR